MLETPRASAIWRWLIHTPRHHPEDPAAKMGADGPMPPAFGQPSRASHASRSSCDIDAQSGSPYWCTVASSPS